MASREDLVNATASTNEAMRSTEKDQGTSHEEIAQLTVISLAIVLTNSLVFVLFKFNKKLRSPANYILLSLAVSDFITGFINIPLFIIVTFTSVVPSPFDAPLTFTRMVLHNLTAISGIYHTAGITLERYLAITRPLSHRSSLHSRKVFKAIASIWFGSAVLAFIPFAWYNELQRNKPLERQLSMAHITVCIIFTFLLPYVFLTYAHVVMFRVISCRSQCGRGTGKGRRDLSNDKKTIITFAIMAMVFLICWFPWFILQLLTLFEYPVPFVVYHVFILIRYMSSIINPLLYTFLKRDFQQAIRQLVCGKRAALHSSPSSTAGGWKQLSNRKRAITTPV